MHCGHSGHAQSKLPGEQDSIVLLHAHGGMHGAVDILEGNLRRVAPLAARAADACLNLVFAPGVDQSLGAIFVRRGGKVEIPSKVCADRLRRFHGKRTVLSGANFRRADREGGAVAEGIPADRRARFTADHR